MSTTEKKLRERIKSLEAELCEVNTDRAIFRSILVETLKEAIRIHGLGSYWSMSNLIEILSKDLQRVKRWDW